MDRVLSAYIQQSPFKFHRAVTVHLRVRSLYGGGAHARRCVTSVTDSLIRAVRTFHPLVVPRGKIQQLHCELNDFRNHTESELEKITNAWSCISARRVEQRDLSYYSYYWEVKKGRPQSVKNRKSLPWAGLQWSGSSASMFEHIIPIKRFSKLFLNSCSISWQCPHDEYMGVAGAQFKSQNSKTSKSRDFSSIMNGRL